MEYRSYGGLDDRITQDGDAGFVGFNNRLRPDQLQQGLLADSQNMRLGRNGEAQVRKGIRVIEAPFAVEAEGVLVLPTEAQIGDGVTALLPTIITAASLDAGTNEVTLTLGTPAGHSFAEGDEVFVEGIGFDFTDPNGTHTLAAGTTSTSLVYVLSSSVASTYTTDATSLVGFNMVLDEALVTEVYASCAFSDPSDDASQYILIASNAKVVAKNLATGTTTDLTYPTGVSVGAASSMLQAFNKVFIFRKGQTALEWDGDFGNNFEYVGSGDKTQPKQLSPTRVDIVDGKATAQFASLADMNGLSVGDTFIVETSGSPTTFEVGTEYRVSARDDVAFEVEFFVQLADQANITGVIFQQLVSQGLGFIHMPAPEFAVYHQRRLVMPFQFDPAIAPLAYTARDNLDEIIASDIIDSDTYDQIYAKYRFNAGLADFTVGLHSFAEDNLLVFNRNSIHLVQNTNNLAAATTKLLTDEVGCVARDSIVQVGNRIIFLSDNGVYGTDFLDEYNLRGTETPLSEPINPIIDRINRATWSKSVATYFDNRYYIAVPIDGSQRNNALLIYNFLNGQWESVDTVNSSNWDIEALIVAGDGDQRGLYAINSLGGIHRIDSRLEGTDLINVQIGGSNEVVDIPAALTTRQYTLGTLERKKWNGVELHIESSTENQSDLTISAETENPDSTIPLENLSDYNPVVRADENFIVLSDFRTEDFYLNESLQPYIGTYQLVSVSGTLREYQKGSSNNRLKWESNPLEADFGLKYIVSGIGTFWSSTDATLEFGPNATNFFYDFYGVGFSGLSSYLIKSQPTVLDAGEDVSIRARIGNARGHGIQFTVNNTSGRPRIRAIRTQGSISFRSTQKAI